MPVGLGLSVLILAAGLMASNPPLGTDGVVHLLEDTSYEYRAADFGFSDPGDVPPDDFRRIIITSLPSVGRLLYDGLPIAAGDPVYLIPDVPRRWYEQVDTKPWKSLAISGDGTVLVGLWWEMSPEGLVGGGVRQTDTTGAWDLNLPAQAWSAVALSADGSSTIAAAKNGRLFRSSGFSTFWLVDGTNADWVSVAMSADGQRILAAPRFGRVRVSSDGGLNWVQRMNSMHWSKVAISENGAVMVAAGAGLWISSDGGVNWERRTTSDDYRGLAMAADGSILGVTQSESFSVSQDLGRTWEPRGPELDWDQISTSGDASRWLALASDRLYVSLDGGHTWSVREEALRWTAIAASADGHTLAAAPATGFIRRTTTDRLPLVFEPAPQASGSPYATVGFRVGDGGPAGSNLAESANQLAITVEPVNDPPVAALALPDVTGVEHTPLITQFPANTFVDSDGPAEFALTYSASLATGQPLPDWLAFDPSTRSFTGTPRGGRHPETWRIRVTATDAGVPPASGSTEFRIQLTNVEDPPAGANPLIAADEDAVFTFSPDDFGFHDPLDNPPNRWRRLLLLSLPERGLLTVDGSPAAVGTSVRTNPSRAAPPWTTGLGGSHHMWDIAISADGRHLAAIEDSGYIRLSNDGGASWRDRVRPTGWSGSGRGITISADGQHVAALEGNGFVHLSADGGVTWQARLGPASLGHLAGSADGSRLFALSASAGLQTSDDFGDTWTPRVLTGTIGFWVDLAASRDGQRLVIATREGPIYLSKDAGATWTPRASNRLWNSVCISADGQKLAAVAHNAPVSLSDDGGQTWTTRGPTGSWLGIACSGDGEQLAVVGRNYPVFVSDDRGRSWKQVASANDWRSIACSLDGTKMAAAGLFANLIVSSSQPAQRLEFQPAPESHGPNYAHFDFKVMDDGAEPVAMALEPNSMTIDVTSVNDPPTLDPIANPPVLPPEAEPPPILLTGLTAGGGEAQALSLQAVSSHPGIIPHPTIDYSSPETQATLRYSLAPRAEGTVVITVTAHDDGRGEADGPAQSQRQFTVTISPYFFDWSQWFGLPSDPEADGGNHLLAYAFGLKPGLAASGPLVLDESTVERRGFPFINVANSESEPRFSLLYGVRRGPGLDATVELSADLIDWEPTSTQPEPVAEDDLVKVLRLPFPDRLLNGMTPRFARVRVRAD
ncbi:MAG: putative Ig domain-containing protein [Verrucomicrobiales bacterium]